MTRPATYLRVHKRKQWEQEQGGNKPAAAKQPVTVIIRREAGEALRATRRRRNQTPIRRAALGHHDRQKVPARHWRCYGDHTLPTGAEALEEPFRAFQSWFLRVTFDRCGKERLFSKTHAAQVVTSVDGASSRPVRRIALLG